MTGIGMKINREQYTDITSGADGAQLRTAGAGEDCEVEMLTKTKLYLESA